MSEPARWPGLPRRRVAGLLAGMGAAGVLAPVLARPHGALPLPASLAAELAGALGMRRALVVMASLDGCPFCATVRDAYLVPLRSEGQPVVQVDMNSARPLVDAAGRDSTHGAVVRALRVRMAPTVLFLGPQGLEAAPRLVGVPLLDFYGAYLDERVRQANQAIA